MPRKFPLNKNEKGQISACKLQGKIYKFHCKRTVMVPNICEKLSKGSYGTRIHSGRPPKITNAAKCQLFLEASKRQSSSRDLQKSQI